MDCFIPLWCGDAFSVDYIFLKEVVAYYGLLAGIILDRDQQSIGLFCKTLMSSLATELYLSTYFHP